MTDMIVREY